MVFHTIPVISRHFSLCLRKDRLWREFIFEFRKPFSNTCFLEFLLNSRLS
ncbi:hypothetical protein NEIMUCOT_05965 [Neisseria mucosa ATCC 25996]|uniref:Uncharacterized protein n=1 Tax=Neisseria mucosa (strain ATCC 25996 / DSM 4631 / NCTC 10774 / M26) TaxID=546266 RepID=D2ZZ91_NEIM2|nr:hypothetical protein NEIMUCOT_05965 [Neisseria mucosa ATCC 25996]